MLITLLPFILQKMKIRTLSLFYIENAYSKNKDLIINYKTFLKIIIKHFLFCKSKIIKHYCFAKANTVLSSLLLFGAANILYSILFPTIFLSTHMLSIWTHTTISRISVRILITSQ